MMTDLAEAVLRAMWTQAKGEGQELYVDETALGAAMADLDGYNWHVHLTRTGDDGHLKVEFR